MKANIVKWINHVYLIISQSLRFWIEIVTKGIVHTFTVFYEEDYPERIITKTRYLKALSFVWLLLFVNLFLASTFYMQINHPLINFLSYIILLVFIALTVFISWLSYILVTSDHLSETESLLTAFHSAVRFWPSSLSFSLYLVITMIIGYGNIILLFCILPGLYFQLSKLLMARYRELIKDTQLLLKH